MTKSNNTCVGKIIKKEKQNGKIYLKILIEKEDSCAIKDLVLDNCNFQVGDYVRITPDNALQQAFENMMIYAEYHMLKDRILRSTEKELEEYHKFMIGKLCEYNKENEKTDYAMLFMNAIIDYKFEYKPTNREAILVNFMNSKYTSDYFKTRLKSTLLDEEFPKLDKRRLELEEEANYEEYELQEIKVRSVVNGFIKSDRDLKDLTKEEIEVIIEGLQNYIRRTQKKDHYLIGDFFGILFHLQSKEAKEYLNATANSEWIVCHMLLSVGMSYRAEFYSNVPSRTYLNEKHLEAIFKQLLKLDVRKVIAFVHMVANLNVLSARSFIEAFYNLGNVGYTITDCVDTKIRKSNYETNCIREDFLKSIQNLYQHACQEYQKTQILEEKLNRNKY